MNYLCSQADEFFYANWETMWKNYRAYNADYDQDDFQKFCDPLGLDIGTGKDYVQAFNHVHNKIDVLSGEEEKRPWNYHVVSLAPNTTNKILRQREGDYRKFINAALNKEAQLAQQEGMMQLQGVPPEQQEEAKKQLEQQIQKEMEFILTPELIEQKYESFKTAEEQALEKIMKRATIKEHLKHKKTQSWFNSNISGLEYVGVWMKNGKPHLEVINPLGVAYHKSPEEQFTQDGDYVVYKREMTTGDVLDNYGHLMKKKDLKRLDDYSGNVYGLDAKLYSKDGYSPSHWENIRYKSNNDGTPSSGDILHSGQYGQSTGSQDDYHTVYTGFWKSQRLMGFITWYDEYHKKHTDIVSEEFELPDEHRTRSEKQFGVTKKIYTWVEEGLQHELQWEWAPEIWWGTRINDDIFCQIEPYPYAYQTTSDPYDVKLPIYGAVFSAANAPMMSTMGRMMPWQKLYLVIMSKFLKLIGLDKGRLTFLNVLMVDKDIGVEMVQKYAEDSGIIPYNPLQNKETAGMMNTLKVAESVDMSNTDKIAHYAEILRFVEQQIGMAAGIAPQREARTISNTNVSDNLRDVAQSAVITETKFALHDLLWGEVLNGYLKLLQQEIVETDPEYLRYWLSDRELYTIKTRDLDLSDIDMAAILEDNAKTHRNLEALKQQAHAVLQNEERALSKLTRLMPAESLTEFREYVDDIEAQIQKDKQALGMQQSQSQEKMQQLQIDNREDEQQHEIEKERMIIQGKLEVEKVKAALNQQAPDHSGIIANAHSDAAKLTIEDKKLAQKDRELDAKVGQEEKDREVEREKIQSQEKIARMKPKPTSK